VRTHIKEASTITGRCLFIFIYISLTYELYYKNIDNSTIICVLVRQKLSNS